MKVRQPWEPFTLNEFELRAFKSLANCNASDGQQKIILDVLLNKFCCVYDQSFRPGPDGHRATDFAEGKRYVGNRILNAIKSPVESKETT
jgi:hypothetical protein